MDSQHRHDLKHDKFVDEIGALSVRARTNQRFLLMLAGAFVGIALLVFGIYFYRNSREASAQQALASAIETFQGTVGEARPEGSTGPHFATEAERTAAAERMFKDVQSGSSGTDAADVAGIYLARIAVTRGDVKTAQALLREFVDDHEENILAGSARFSLYQLRIENGEAAQVAAELEAELSKAEPVLPADTILILLASAWEMQGNKEKSLEAYRRITTEFPESPYAVEAARRGAA